jgi:hypothetical protein
MYPENGFGLVVLHPCNFTFIFGVIRAQLCSAFLAVVLENLIPEAEVKTDENCLSFL